MAKSGVLWQDAAFSFYGTAGQVYRIGGVANFSLQAIARMSISHLQTEVCYSKLIRNFELKRYLKMRQHILLIAIFLTGWMAQAVEAQIGVSPPRFEVTLDGPPATESAQVINYGPRPIQVKVAVYNWDLDERSSVRLLPPAEQSLDQWLALNPLNFTIPAGKYQTVRFSIRPRVTPTAGEHRAIVYFEEIPDPADTSQASVVGRMGIAIYGYAGEVIRRGELHGVTVKTEKKLPVALFDLESYGNAHVRLNGQYGIWPAAVYPGKDKTSFLVNLHSKDFIKPDGLAVIGVLPTTPVLPGTRRLLTLSLPETLPPGEYTLDINGTFGDMPLDMGVSFGILPRVEAEK